MLYKSTKLEDFIKDIIVDHHDLYGNTDVSVRDISDTKQAEFVKYLIDQDENMEFMSVLDCSDFSCLFGSFSKNPDMDMKIEFSNTVIDRLTEYFSNDMQELIDDTKEEVEGEMRMDFLEENAMRFVTDKNTGEMRWFK